MDIEGRGSHSSALSSLIINQSIKQTNYIIVRQKVEQRAGQPAACDRTLLSTVCDRAFLVTANDVWNELPRHTMSASGFPDLLRAGEFSAVV